MKYRWIMFDADGTLYDFDGAQRYAFAETLGAFGISASPEIEAIYSRINSALFHQMEEGLVTSKFLRVERFRRLFHELGVHADADQCSREYLGYLAKGSRLLPGVSDVILHLHTQYRLMIITNGISEVQRSRIAASPIHHCFEFLVISDEVGIAKPAPGIFDAAFKQMGGPEKKSVLIVGDSLSSDIAGGTAYGIDTCWYNPEGKTPPENIEATYQIRRIEDLLPLLLEESRD